LVLAQEHAVTPKTPKTAKISVKIWEPLIEKLDTKMEAACLRRDAYLTKLLKLELVRLEKEVSLPNSDAAFNFVSERLRRLHPKLVSLALPRDLTQQLDETCRRKQIVRDAFFNRLFLLLAASPRTIDTLLFRGERNWRHVVWNENKHNGLFFQRRFDPLEPATDPFWAIRDGMEIYARDDDLEDYVEPTSGRTVRVTRDTAGAVKPVDSLYTVVFDQKVQDHDLRGLNCYMPDWRIPGQAAEHEHQAKLDELLESLS
jgi:hypothetical protein